MKNRPRFLFWSFRRLLARKALRLEQERIERERLREEIATAKQSTVAESLRALFGELKIAAGCATVARVSPA